MGTYAPAMARESDRERALAQSRRVSVKQGPGSETLVTDDDTTDSSEAEPSTKTRQGAGGTPVAADSVLDTSMPEEDASTVAERATPPTEGPAAAGNLPG
jgi:hypothetical protein